MSLFTVRHVFVGFVECTGSGIRNAEFVLHVEIVLKTKQPEAETSLVYDVFIRVIKKRARVERVRRGKEKRNKHVKHVKCKDVLRFICGLMRRG